MITVQQVSTRQFEEGRALVDRLIAAARIDRDDIAALRRHFEALGHLTRTEAESLFALDRAVADKHSDWTTFFVETITDYVVWQSRPTGLVNGSQAEWLIAQADAGATLDAFAALVNVLAEADRVPAWLPGAIHARAARWPSVAGALHQARAA